MKDILSFELVEDNYSGFQNQIEFVVMTTDHYDDFSIFQNEERDTLEVQFPDDFYQKVGSIYSDQTSTIDPEVIIDGMYRDYAKGLKAFLTMRGNCKKQVKINKVLVNGR